MRKFIPVSHPCFSGNEKKYVNECLDSSWISSSGRFISEFENAFAEFCGVEHAVACNNGTSALHLAMVALGVQPGDEVIVPTLTFVATANAVRYCGATPVFVDSEPFTMNLDPQLIEAKITPATKGIMVVHLYGHPVDMDPVLDIARRHGLFVVEDAAEAHGAFYRGRRVGGLGDLATFSFYGNKIITTGEGGMVTTRDPELARKVRLLRGQGMDPERRYWFPIVGYNYRMTNIEAAIGLAQLENVDEHLERRREIAEQYRIALHDLRDLIAVPQEADWAHHVYWAYTVRLTDRVALSRDTLAAGLLKAGIETRPVFHPMHHIPPYREENSRYPIAEDFAARGITLPAHSLLTADDISYIAETLETLCATRERIRAEVQQVG